MREVDPKLLLRQRDFIEKIRVENMGVSPKPLAFVETYGCAQNENDSERLRGMLVDMGYVMAEDKSCADVIIFNTCSIRENADFKVFGNIGKLKPVKQLRPDILVGVCGCMMEQPHNVETIKKKYRHIDMVFGTHSLYKFPEILDKARRGKKAFYTETSDGEIAEGISTYREKPPLAKVSVMFGCNNFCTYCIVPYVRGRERSRSVKNILLEIENVAQLGYKEVLLLGQNVNSYGMDLGEEGISFAKLLELVCKIDGIERIRFMTSHPKDISDELIEVMAREEKICNQLHLPVQSGSNRILEKMNRKYTRERYLEIVEKVREKIPDIALSTDIIVGFPGETDEDFEETLELLRQVEFDMIYSFIYSRRKGTPAALLPDCLTDEEKHRNFDRMTEVQNEISRRKNEAFVGRRVTVLAENVSKTNPEFLTGRTEGGKIVNFRGDKSLVGQLLEVAVTECRTWSMTGEII